MKFRQLITVLSVTALLIATTACTKVADTAVTTTASEQATTTGAVATTTRTPSSSKKKTTSSKKPSAQTTVVTPATTTPPPAVITNFFGSSSSDVLADTSTLSSLTRTNLLLEDSSLMRMDLPNDWTQTLKEDNYLVFTKNGKTVGRVVEDTLWSVIADGTVISQSTYDDITTKTVTYPTADGVAHVYRFDSFPFKDGTSTRYFFLEIDAAAVSQYTFTDMAASLRKAVQGNNPSLDLSNSTKTLRIGVYGNSFVGSSSVGSTLRAMCSQSGRSVTVTPVSRGYYTVSKYMADSNFISTLTGGTYDVVFMCGLYGTTDLVSAMDFERYALLGDSIPVLLPAPNEWESGIEMVDEYCPDTRLANWRELDYYLRSEGINVDYLRIADTHGHSRPLSGYAAACMMYYMMFNEMPSKIAGIDAPASAVMELGASAATAYSVVDQVYEKTAAYLGVKI